MGTHDKHRINTLIDKLTLESLALMEKHILSKIELENCMISGEDHLAKARYIMGQNQVSKLQLPNEVSNEFQAMSLVSCTNNLDVIQDHCYDLEVKPISKQMDDNSDVSSVVNPIHWFGVLVPQSLHLAQTKFKQTLYCSVKAANVQRKLYDCLTSIAKLNKLIDN